jgi:PHP family Zn ribbon phosphoesterase
VNLVHDAQSAIRHLPSAILADLHLHTCLSPCAEVEMIPPLIIERAQALGLGLIAVTDHNAAGNCAAVMRAAEVTGIAVLPGMEVQTAEEVHVVCLFDTLEQVLTWQGTVFDHLPDRTNPEDVLGGQFVVDEAGDYLRTETRLLLTSTDLPLEEVVRRVRALGGLPIPAHIDRPSFSLLANLGFVPPHLDVPALEIFRRSEPAQVIAQSPDVAAYPLIRSSDAHQLSEMARRVRLELPLAAGEPPTLAMLANALARRAFTLCES